MTVSTRENEGRRARGHRRWVVAITCALAAGACDAQPPRAVPAMTTDAGTAPPAMEPAVDDAVSAEIARMADEAASAPDAIARSTARRRAWDELTGRAVGSPEERLALELAARDALLTSEPALEDAAEVRGEQARAGGAYVPSAADIALAARFREIVEVESLRPTSEQLDLSLSELPDDVQVELELLRDAEAL